MTKGIFSQKSETEERGGGNGEHDLWISVLSKAAHDAIYSTDWRESRIAISWFKTGGFSVRVCKSRTRLCAQSNGTSYQKKRKRNG